MVDECCNIVTLNVSRKDLLVGRCCRRICVQPRCISYRLTATVSILKISTTSPWPPFGEIVQRCRGEVSRRRSKGRAGWSLRQRPLVQRKPQCSAQKRIRKVVPSEEEQCKNRVGGKSATKQAKGDKNKDGWMFVSYKEKKKRATRAGIEPARPKPLDD
ncbi:hypothetical protein K505DRAFT_114471 [Melanomma pulvis-pyrius CBS 109.77]|uniref:Uncharacterized protein n=1 Tax=Melanomma pulvis-pyrius CBS 109.77 TaxID=1314802 RepID=A0A6A6XZ33_9PLEO|nr:hypothetical protein K505DRAFT_114471 [Melanomma pulvis-pyrius CBS 109.77]